MHERKASSVTFIISKLLRFKQPKCKDKCKVNHCTLISSYTHVFLPPGGVTGGTPTVGPSSSDLPVYQEVWFIALIAILALIILFIGLACCLRRTRHKVPYIRERMPLVAKQKKMGAPLSYCIDPYTGNVVSTVR